MKPEFDKAAVTLSANDPPVALVKVDCTEAGKDTCGRFEVKGYPTVKIFRNGELSQDYSGPREAPGIIKFMKSQAGPASKNIVDAAELAKLQERPDVVVVGLFDSATDAEPFLRAANQLREDADFAHSTVSLLRRSSYGLQRCIILYSSIREPTTISISLTFTVLLFLSLGSSTRNLESF